jgi:hypothetical protein
MTFRDKILENLEFRDLSEDPCWDTHKQVGTKMKGGKEVPNCVPKEEVVQELTSAEKKLINQMYDKKGNLTPMGKKVMAHGKANSKLTPKARDADNARRKEYKAFQKSKANEAKKPGLWDNMHARRKAGKPKLKPGDKNYPKTLDIEKSKK